MIKRILKDIVTADCGRGKIIVLLGVRRVGKTVLLSELKEGKEKALLLNCEHVDVVSSLEGMSRPGLKKMLSPYNWVFIDEAHRVKHLGSILKTILGLRLKVQVVVTGAPSPQMTLEINQLGPERVIERHLFPLSLKELASNSSRREEKRLLEDRMVYGAYPEIADEPEYAKRHLTELVGNHLYRDLFFCRGVVRPEVMPKLLHALALNLGNETTYKGLSKLLKIDLRMVENYIHILEKYFMVFRLESFSVNLRNGIRKSKKFYFYDNGLRNALVSNFDPLALRNDTGALWENLLVSEMVKQNDYSGNPAKFSFWRTYKRRKIDLIEEKDGSFRTFVFKWDSKEWRPRTKVFAESYPGSTHEVITPKNYWTLVT